MAGGFGQPQRARRSRILFCAGPEWRHGATDLPTLARGNDLPILPIHHRRLDHSRPSDPFLQSRSRNRPATRRFAAVQHQPHARRMSRNQFLLPVALWGAVLAGVLVAWSPLYWSFAV